MLHFHQNNPFMQIFLSTTTQVLETSLEAISSKSFQLFHRINNYVRNITKAPSSREKVKISWSQVRCSSVDTLPFAEKSLTTTDRCAGEFSWRRNQLLVLRLSWCFILIIPKARKDKYVHYFMHSFTFRDEFIMDNELAVKNFQHDLSFPLSTQNFCFQLMVISIQIDVVFVDRTKNTMFHRLW
jgi:hypothetical protein